jgi:hypothetical protein
MMRTMHASPGSSPVFGPTWYACAATLPTITLLLTIGSLPLPTLNTCG